MLANQATYPEAVAAAFAAYDAACKQLVGLDFTQLTPAVLLDVQSRREHAARITANVDHRILAALQAQATPKEIGARTWAEVLMIRMQISKTEANQRIAEAADLGPRCAIDGQPLEPVLPNTAQALADGAINHCHVDEIRSTVSKAAKYASAAKCAELEQILARRRAASPHSHCAISAITPCDYGIRTATARICPPTNPASTSGPKMPMGWWSSMAIWTRSWPATCFWP